MRKLLPVVLLVVLIGPASMLWAQGAETPDVPPKKQTVLKLYVTSKQAYTLWKASPDEVKILDCRTPGEYIFVGHAPMAHNVPLMFVQYRIDLRTQSPVMQMNPSFMTEVKQRLSPSDTILVMCRSGVRSARATNMLAKAGFRKVYNVVDGFEGDTNKDKKSSHFGKRTVNGWKNSAVPWTYKLDPKLAYLPEQP